MIRWILLAAALLAGAAQAQFLPLGLKVQTSSAPFVSNNPNLGLSSGANGFKSTLLNNVVQ